jgi:mitotic spindle assembly checkpoint protein MAD1
MLFADNTQDENLRAKINSLEYELKNLQQERGLLSLQHEKELREQQARAEADFKKYQVGVVVLACGTRLTEVECGKRSSESHTTTRNITERIARSARPKNQRKSGSRAATEGPTRPEFVL